MITREGIEGRIERLQEVALELMGSMGEWRKGDDPLLYLERRALIEAMADAVAGVEEGRVRLARALQRITAAEQKDT